MSENEQLYRDLVEHSHDLICTHDLNGVLLTVNHAAAQKLGYETKELVDRNLRELLSEKIHRGLEEYLNLLREKKFASGRFELSTKGGEIQIWEYTSTLRTEGVEIPFVRGMAHDITWILNSQQALRESEERLRIAAEVGRMYAWEWNPATGEVRRSAECEEILGASAPAGESGVEDYFAQIHPEDRDVLWNLASSLTPEAPSYRTEYRRYRSERELAWLGESGHATFDEARKMVRLIGMTADITERKRAEELLRASEKRSREIVKKSPVAMLIERGTEEKNEFFNDKFTTLFGYTNEDLPSITEWWPLAYPDKVYREAIRAGWEGRVRESVRHNSEFAPMEAMVRCKDGSYRYVEIHFAPFGEINLVSFVDLTARKNAELELAKVGGRLINAHDEERTRIARELHDDVCQRLALLVFGLDELERSSVNGSAGVRSRAGELREQTAEILTDLQSLSHELHSAKLEFLGLVAAVKALCKKFEQEQKGEVDFQSRDLPNPVPPDISLCLFRILQEALHNSAKHSGARKFEVQLWASASEINLTVKDFGTGFDAGAPKTSRGLGLISMKERIRLLDGSLLVKSQIGSGTTIHARVPYCKAGKEKELNEPRVESREISRQQP